MIDHKSGWSIRDNCPWIAFQEFHLRKDPDSKDRHANVKSSRFSEGRRNERARIAQTFAREEWAFLDGVVKVSQEKFQRVYLRILLFVDRVRRGRIAYRESRPLSLAVYDRLRFHVHIWFSPWPPLKETPIAAGSATNSAVLRAVVASLKSPLSLAHPALNDARFGWRVTSTAISPTKRRIL